MSIKNLLSSSGSPKAGMSLSDSSMVSLCLEEPSELAVSLAAILEMILNMIDEEFCFGKEFFSLESGISDYLNSIFEPLISSFTRRFKEKVFVAENFNEVTLLYAKMLDSRPTNPSDTYVLATHHIFSDYTGSRVEILVRNQVVSLESALGRDKEPSTAISIITRKFAALITDNISYAGKYISMEEHRKL